MSTKKALWTQLPQYANQQKKTPPKPHWRARKPIRKASLALQRRQRWYKALLTALYGDRNRGCGVLGCDARMMDNHHTRGKNGEMLCRSEWFMPVCRSHHDLAKNQPDEAREIQGVNPFGTIIPLLCPAGKWNEAL